MKKFFRYPVVILGVIAAITVALGLQIPKLQLDNDAAKFLPENHPARATLNRMTDTYGGSMIIIIGVTFPDGTITTASNMAALQALTADLEAIPDGVDKVTSIANVDFLTGTPDGIEAKKMVESLPANPLEEQVLLSKLESWKPYRGNLYSQDKRSTLISVKMTSGADSPAAEVVYYQVRDILKKYTPQGLEFHVAGMPSIMVLINDSIKADLAMLVPFVGLILLVILYLSFRRIGGVVLPLLTVGISTVWLMGLMSVFGAKLTMIGAAIPVIMVAVASAYGIHLVSHYFDDIRKEKGIITRDRNREIILHNISRIGGAILLAALTTFFGFGSLITSGVIPLIDFGIYTALGTAIAFVVAMTFIPAVIMMRGQFQEKHTLSQNQDKAPRPDRLGGFLVRLYHGFADNRPRAWVILSAILVVSIAGTLMMKVGTPMINQFKPGTEIRTSDAWLNKNFTGTTTMNLLISGETPGSLLNPAVLTAIDGLTTHLETTYPQEVGTVLSFVDLVKKINQIMNADEKGDYYEIPTDPAKYRMKSKEELPPLLAQYMLLFSGNTSEYINDSIEPSETRVSVQLKTADYEFIRKLEKDIRAYAAANFPAGYTLTITGNAVIQNTVTEIIVTNKVWNIVSSLIAVFIILLVFYRSWVAAALGVITLALPILFNFAIMGFFGIHLDSGTAMVASVSIGIGIDYTIHYMNAWYHERQHSNDLRLITDLALKSSGRAIVFNAIAVALGFLVNIFSNEMPLIYFGILVAVTMVTASLAALTLLPFLLNLINPKFMTKKSIWKFME